MNKVLRFLNYFLFVILVISIGFYLGKNYKISFNEQGKFNGFKEMKYQKKMNSIISLIENQYLEKVDQDSLVDGMITHLMNQLDPHSTYIPKKQSFDLEMQTTGSYEGLGMKYTRVRDTFVVSDIISGSPNKNELQIGDKILDLNNISVVNAKGTTLNDIIFNSKQNTITAQVKRKDSIKKLVLKKGKIEISSVEDAVMLQDSLAYIKLTGFSESAHKDFVNSLVKLKNSGAKSLILDLRDNPGGLIEIASSMADEFLSENKLIAYTLDRYNNKKEYKSTANGNFITGNVYVLVNENSASASELLSGALQDNNRAKIIGTQTFGKGLVQKEVPLNDGSKLRLTVAQYYTPKGRKIQKTYTKGSPKVVSFNSKNKPHDGGIIPDVKIDNDAFNLEAHLYFIDLFIVSEIEKYQDLSEKEFKETIPEQEIYNDFYLYLKKDSLMLVKENNPTLEKYLKAELGEKLFRDNYRIKNTYQLDSAINKAIELENK